MKIFRVSLLVRLMLFLFACIQISFVGADELKSSEVLIDDIRKGGYVLYFRHAATNRSQTDIDTSNLDDCSTQRNLSEKGREQSRVIGKAFRELDIPVGTVLTSPYCRCVDTAMLAFGRGIKRQDLQFTISKDKQETQRLSDVLKVMLATIPAAGTNTVLVGHTGNLREATNVWPKPEAVMHVFEPLGVNGFKHIGRIEPDRWQVFLQKNR